MHWAWTGISPRARRTTAPATTPATAPAPPPDMSRQRQNLINSFAPVALFDRDYDDQGITPIRDGKYPKLAEGAQIERVLVLYNDEYRDPAVQVEVQVRDSDMVYAKGTRTYRVTPGEHVQIPYMFQVPYTRGANIEVVLTTYKGGVVKFTEVRPFRVTARGRNGVNATAITLGEAR